MNYFECVYYKCGLCKNINAICDKKMCVAWDNCDMCKNKERCHFTDSLERRCDMERLTENYLGCNQIKDCGNAKCDETCKEVESCDSCPISKAIDKLAEYEQAEEDGVLIKLPCRVGDKLYGLYCYNREWKIREMTVSDFIIRAYRIQRIEIYFEETGMMFETCLFDGTLNENLFATKAEAEQALAKMKGE